MVSRYNRERARHGQEEATPAAEQGRQFRQAQEGQEVKAGAALDRLREPSTWAGFSAMALLFGQAEAAQALQVLGAGVPDVLAGAAALLSIVIRERKP